LTVAITISSAEAAGATVPSASATPSAIMDLRIFIPSLFFGHRGRFQSNDAAGPVRPLAADLPARMKS
jgi:hypothetical protein